MPCYDSRSTSEYGRSEAIAELQPKIDELTAMLCWALQTVMDNTTIGLPDKIAVWWLDHQAHDAKAGNVNQFR